MEWWDGSYVVLWVSAVLFVLFVVGCVAAFFIPPLDHQLPIEEVLRMNAEHSTPVVRFLRCSSDLKRTKVRNYFVYHALYQRVEYR